MKSIQKLRIEDSMAGLLINVMAFKEDNTGRRSGKATPALDKSSCVMNQTFAYRNTIKENLPIHQLNNELNYVGKSDVLKHNLATVLSSPPKGSVLLKAKDRSSWMLTNTVCRN